MRVLVFAIEIDETTLKEDLKEIAEEIVEGKLRNCCGATSNNKRFDFEIFDLNSPFLATFLDEVGNNK